jgi:hypothetical protein
VLVFSDFFKSDNEKFIKYVQNLNLGKARKILKENLKIDDEFSFAAVEALSLIQWSDNREILLLQHKKYKEFILLFREYGIDFYETHEISGSERCSWLDFIIVNALIEDIPLNESSFFCQKPGFNPNLTIEAVRFGLFDVVKRSLELGVDVNFVERNGCTAIFYLPHNFYKNNVFGVGSPDDAEKMLDLLISYGADLTHLSHSGCSFIDYLPEEKQNFYKEKYGAVNGDPEKCFLLKRKKKTGQ